MSIPFLPAPPLYWVMTHPPLSAPPGPEAALMPDPGPVKFLQQLLLLRQLSQGS